MSSQLQIAATIATVLTCACAGVAAYVDIKSDIAVIETQVSIAKESGSKLDTYDAYLQKQSDDARNRIIQIEAQQQYVIATQVRLEQTMDKILIEMKAVNENVIRISK